MKKPSLKLREPEAIKPGSVFFNCERDSMLRVIRVYDCWCSGYGIPGAGRMEKQAHYITWRPDGSKQQSKGSMKLASLTRLPYFEVNAVHVYCAGGQSFGFGLTPEDGK